MTPFIESLNPLASQWSTAMTRATWQGGVALAIVWLLCRAIPRIPASVQCWLWRLAYIKLLIALVWTTAISVPLLRSPSRELSVHGLSVAAAVDPGPPTVPGNHATWESPLLARSNNLPLAKATVSAEVVAARPTGKALLFVGWSVGVIVCITRLARGWRKTIRLRRSSRRCEDVRLLATAQDLADRFRIRPPGVAIVDLPISPMVLAGWTPCIVLPATFVRSCSPDQLQAVLAHELAHLRRRDLLWNALAAAGNTLFFFHPMIWFARRPWRMAQEIACDAATVAVLDARPADYARFLVDVIERLGTSCPQVTAVGMFDSGHEFKGRLSAMKHFSSGSRRRRIVVVGFVAVIAAIGIPSWTVVAAQKKADRNAETQPIAAPAPAAVEEFDEDPAVLAKMGQELFEQRRRLDETKDLFAQAEADIKSAKDGTIRKSTPEDWGRVDPSMQRKIESRNELAQRIDDLSAQLGETHPVIVRAKQDLVARERDLAALAEKDASRFLIRWKADGTGGILIPRDLTSLREMIARQQVAFDRARERLAAARRAAKVTAGADPSARPATAPVPTTTSGPSHVDDATRRGIPPVRHGVVVARTAGIRSQEAGIIKRVNFKEGDRVTTGDVLIELDDSQIRTRVEAATADLRQKEIQLSQQRDLYQDIIKQGKTSSDVQDAESAVEIAGIALRLQRLQQEQFKVTAPFTGVIGESSVQVGEFVSAGVQFAKLVDVDDLKVVFQAYESDGVLGFKPGLKIRLRLSKGSGQEIVGEVYFVSPYLESDTSGVTVKATLQHSKVDVRPGMECEVFLPRPA